MVQRVQYRRRCRYNTRSNLVKKVVTPGANLVLHRLKKVAKRPKCGDCKRPIEGVRAVRPHLYKNLKKRDRTVSRAYGGSRCHSCVRDRIIRAFLTEEQKVLRKVLKEREQKAKSHEKSSKKAAKVEAEKPKEKSDKPKEKSEKKSHQNPK